MIEVTIITSSAEISAIAAEWQAIDEATSPRHPFSSPLWCELWWKHFAREGILIRDLMRIFVVRDQGRVIGIAPMMLTLRPAIGPLRMRELQFFGADANLTEIRGPVCRPEQAEVVVAALKGHLESIASEWDWVQWRGLRMTPDQFTRDGSEALLECRHEISDHYLVLPPSWTEFYKGLPRNIKESLRKCYNSLARDGLTHEFRVITETVQIDEALKVFLDLHRMRAGATDTVAHHDVFREEKAKRFLESYVRSREGEMHAFQLVFEGQVVASRLGILNGNNLYLYYTGYDLRWRKYSVMTTLLAEILKWSFENRIAVVNLSTGTDMSKTRWRPSTVSFWGGYQVSPRARARFLFQFMARIRRWRGGRRLRLSVANMALLATTLPLLHEGLEFTA